MPASTRTITLDAKFRDQMTKGVKRASSQSSAAFKSLATSVVAPIAGFFAIRSLAATGLDLADLAAEADGVSRSFENLAKLSGQTADAFLTDLRAAARGTISDLELMKKTNEAALLAGENITKRLPELIEIARASAAATGQSVEFLFQSIVLGIGRQSKLILDNLGILVSAEKANQEYAASLGTTANKLTEAERKQAFLNAVVKSGKDIIENTGAAADLLTDSSARMAAEQANLALVVGKELLPLVTKLRDAFTTELKAIREIVEFNSELEVAQRKLEKAQRDFLQLQVQIRRERTRGGDPNIQREIVENMTIALNLQKKELLELKAARDLLRGDEEEEKEKTKPEPAPEEDARVALNRRVGEILAEDQLTLEDRINQIIRAGGEERQKLLEETAKKQVEIIKGRNALVTQISVAQAVLLGKIGEAVGRNEQAIGRKIAIEQIKLLKEVIGGRLRAQQIAAVGAALANPAGLAAAIPQVALITAKFSALRAALGLAAGAAISAIQAPAEPTAEQPSMFGAVAGFPDGGGPPGQLPGDRFAFGARRDDPAIQQELDQLQARQIQLDQEISQRESGLVQRVLDISADVLEEFGPLSAEERGAALAALRAEGEALLAERTQLGGRIGFLLEELGRPGAQPSEPVEINFTVQALDPAAVDWDDIVANNIGPALQNNIDNAVINLDLVPTT